VSPGPRILLVLEEGQLVEGTVKQIIPTGAFVDVGEADGFLPLAAMGSIAHPLERLQVGDRVVVEIRKINRDTGRISLALPG
jgi:small subunit ribosomal protein S1